MCSGTSAFVNDCFLCLMPVRTPLTFFLLEKWECQVGPLRGHHDGSEITTLANTIINYIIGIINITSTITITVTITIAGPITSPPL